MKNLRFSDIALLSSKERKARRIEFHPGSNLILGLNHTGKSTVTKMLFETLGALPTGKLDGWDHTATTCVVLSIDDVEYRVLRQGDHRALFDAEGHLISAATRSRAWVDTFNSITNFNLILSDKSENTAPADPSCFFLPFYINQDGSWGGTWSTFKFLSRFKSPTQPILEYFSQITPSEYYRAKSAKDGFTTTLAENDRELNALRRAKAKLSRALPAIGPKITSADFESEIARLTKEINLLNRQQEELRLTALKQNEALSMVKREIAVAELTLAEYKQDAHFLDRRGLDELICPTCGAEHDESFLGTLEYAEDARSLESTVLRLKASQALLESEIEKANGKRNELSSTYEALDELLQTKKGEMKFSDIVRSLGAGSALDAFDAQEHDLEDKAQSLLSSIHELETQMKTYINKKRRKEIRDRFRDAYSNARGLLNLPSVDTSKYKIHSRPDLSGSGRPRAILAYYAAIWTICSPNGNDDLQPPSVPLVIDCPNQQGQDSNNLPAIVSFLSTRLPSHAQVIVTFEGNVPDKFDRRIELSEPRGLLRENEFAVVSAELDGLVAKMNEALLLSQTNVQP